MFLNESLEKLLTSGLNTTSSSLFQAMVKSQKRLLPSLDGHDTHESGSVSSCKCRGHHFGLIVATASYCTMQVDFRPSILGKNNNEVHFRNG